MLEAWTAAAPDPSAAGSLVGRVPPELGDFAEFLDALEAATAPMPDPVPMARLAARVPADSPIGPLSRTWTADALSVRIHESDRPMEAFDAVWDVTAWAESREHAWVRVVEASRRRQTYDLPLLVEATLEARRARSAGLRWFVDVLAEGAAHPYANPCYRSLAEELERQVGRGQPPATPPDPRTATDGDDPRALGLAACRTRAASSLSSSASISGVHRSPLGSSPTG